MFVILSNPPYFSVSFFVLKMLKSLPEKPYLPFLGFLSQSYDIRLVIVEDGEEELNEERED